MSPFCHPKEQSSKSTKHDKTSVTGFKSMSHFFSHKGAQRRNSDLTVTGKRSVPNFQNFLNASEVCSSLKQDSRKMLQEIFFFPCNNLVQYDNFIQVQRLPLLSLTAELHASEFLTHPGIQKAGSLKSDSYFYASICSESFHTCKISTKTVTLYSKW